MEPGMSYSPTPKPVPVTPVAPVKTTFNPSIIVGTVLLVVALIGLGGAYLWKFTKKPAKSISLNTEVSPTPRNTFPQAVIPTPKFPEWKEYVDSSNLFSVKYPPEYSLKKYSESSFNGIELGFIKPATSASASAQITLKIIYLQNSAKTADQFAQDQLKLEKGSTLFEKTISLKGEWGRGKIIFMEKDGTVYRLSSVIAAPLNFVPTYESTIDQIFSTFTILNPDDRSK